MAWTLKQVLYVQYALLQLTVVMASAGLDCRVPTNGIDVSRSLNAPHYVATSRQWHLQK